MGKLLANLGPSCILPQGLLTRYVALLALLIQAGATSAETQPTLTLLTWEDYIEQELVADFERQYGAKIKQFYFESDSDRDELLGLYGPNGYDLIMVDTVSIPAYQQLGWITPVDTQAIRNISLLELPLLHFREASSACAPYYWGTTGIAYRTDLVDEPITRWSQLFNPSPALKGKILMPKEPDETVGMALKSLGYSMNSTNPKELEQARQLLLKQAPSVKGYTAVAGETEESLLVKGEISALVTYSSDALMLQEAESDITYVLPEEGGAIWADFWCQSKHSSHPELAIAFLEFINTPENAAQNTEYLYGATANQGALKLLSKELLNNPVIFPDKASLARSEPYSKLPPRIHKIHNRIMAELIQLTR